MRECTIGLPSCAITSLNLYLYGVRVIGSLLFIDHGRPDITLLSISKTTAINMTIEQIKMELCNVRLNLF